jgi:hypothetical protein
MKALASIDHHGGSAHAPPATPLAALGAVLALGACTIDADGPNVDAAIDDDPLAIVDEPPPGSLDDLHARIIKPRCSGTPGLCHNGQFEPNLATPGLTYAYLVRRPAIERSDRLRVDVSAPASSFVIDKLRNRNGVATQMPLGAEPLPEEDIAAIEAWIADGARRFPGADPAPVLNNQPRKPEIAIYQGTTRLDNGGLAVVQRGDTITLRHSVHDFETADADIPFGAMILIGPNGTNVVLEPGSATDPQLKLTAHDPTAPPMGAGDLLNFEADWMIPTTVQLVDDMGNRTDAVLPISVVPLALYIDNPMLGIVAFDISPRMLRIDP